MCFRDCAIQKIVMGCKRRATMPSMGIPTTWGTDNPQEQGITVAPLNVEVRYRSAGARRKSYLFPTTKVSQVLVDYVLDNSME